MAVLSFWEKKNLNINEFKLLQLHDWLLEKSKQATTQAWLTASLISLY
jgi:hypothetical protein